MAWSNHSLYHTRTTRPWNVWVRKVRSFCSGYLLCSGFYAWFAVGLLFHYGMFDLNQQPILLQDIVPDVPGFLEILQDMSSFNPSSRVSASVALNRLKKLRVSQTPWCCHKNQTGWNYQGRSFCRTLFEIISAGRALWLACELVSCPPLVHLSRSRVSSKKTDWKFSEHQYTLPFISVS